MARSVLEIVFKTLREGSGDADTSRSLKALEKNVKSTIASFSAFAGAAAAVTAALNYSVKEAMEAEKAQAKLSAVLKATNNAAGMTQTSVNALATELSRMSGIDDELIANSEAVLLTFTQIGRQVFPEAMEAALDMNAVLGGDLQGSIVQLGKALNVTAGDTATASMGMTALRRSGVSFTEEQKKMALEMVKTGDIMGYQKLVLGELNREFGGAAEAMGDTTAGSAQKLKNSFNNLAAAVGTMFLPAIKKANEFLSENADKLTESVEAINAFRDAYQDAAEWLDYTTTEISQGTYASEQMRQAVEDLAIQLQRGAAMTEFYNKQVEAQVSVQAEAEEAMEGVGRANQDMLSLIQSLQSEYTSFTEKNEELKLKLQELTAEQEKVPEWSSKYKDYQVQIDETTGAINKLAAEHEMASKRIAFSLLQQKLASDGLTDAEFNNLLKIGESWGVIDKTVAESAILMNHNMELMADSMQEPFANLKGINQQINQIRNKNGMSFDFYVNIHTAGGFPSLPVTMGGGGAGGEAGPAFEARAGGGMMGNGWVLVGEQGPELITPNRFVIPSDVTRALLASGLMPQYGLATGGPIPSLDGEIVGVPYTTQIGMSTINTPSTPAPSLPPPVIAGEVSQASQVAAAVVPMAQATVAAVQTSAQAQQQASAEAVQTRQIIAEGNSETNGLLRETNQLLRAQQAGITRAMIAAFQQANP